MGNILRMEFLWINGKPKILVTLQIQKVFCSVKVVYQIYVHLSNIYFDQNIGASLCKLSILDSDYDHGIYIRAHQRIP